MNQREREIWLAGLLEGEGCFTLSRPRRGRPVLTMVLSSTDEDVVRTAASILSTEHRVRRVPTRTSSPVHHKAEWDLRLYGRDAEKAMRKVHPYMHQRRNVRITELLEMKGLSHHD